MALLARASKLLKYQIFHKHSGSRSCSSLPISEEAFTSPTAFTSSKATRISILDIKRRPPIIMEKKIFSIIKMNSPKIEEKERPNNGFESSLKEIREELLKFDTGEIQFSKDETRGIAYIKLCNEGRKNALTGKMIVQLSDIVEELEKWDNGKAIFVYSTGDCFCSGMDLTMIKKKCDQFGGYQMSTYMTDVLRRLEALPQVTVAVIQGRVMGGGAEFITSFDFRLMAPNAEARFVHSRMGVSTGIAGGGSRLVRLIGPTKALKLLLTGEKIPALKALEIGLVSAVFEREENILESAVEWLGPLISDRETRIVQTIKKIVHSASTLPIDQALEREKELFVSAWGGPTLMQSLHQGKKHK